MVKAQSSSHLMHQQHLIQLITFNFLETLSSLGMQSYTPAAFFTGLSSSPSPALGSWTSPISPCCLFGSCGFKYYLCVDDCETILPHWTSSLKSWLIHPTTYLAIPFEMLFRQTASQNEWAHNFPSQSILSIFSLVQTKNLRISVQFPQMYCLFPNIKWP